MRIWEQRKKLIPALPIIVSMSPPDYPSAWLHPCIARFRFTWQSHCSSVSTVVRQGGMSHSGEARFSLKVAHSRLGQEPSKMGRANGWDLPPAPPV
jgi:hypothetical protein